MFATHSAIIILYNAIVVHIHNIIVLLCIYSKLCTVGLVCYAVFLVMRLCDFSEIAELKIAK